MGSTEPDEPNKSEQIRQACQSGDLHALKGLAASEGGLLEDELRQIAWPLLLGSYGATDESLPDVKNLPRHRDEDQVQLDVDRSFVYYPKGESDAARDAHKEDLSRVIITVLRSHPMLHYFQGYHDIVQVLLLVLGVNAAIPAVARLSLLRIRDFMLPTMSGTEPHLHLLPTILKATDPVLASHLSHTQPFFALPATLTLYAHEIEEYSSIARLFDFLLASEAVIPVYLFAAVVISRKRELLEIEVDEPEMLHATLSKLPRPLNLDSLIQLTLDLFKRHPPERLPGRIWSRIPNSSVLRTTRDEHNLSQQTLTDGERYFEKEASEIRRRDALLKRQKQLQYLASRYRRPVFYTSSAVAVALLALLFRSYQAPIPASFASGMILGLQQRMTDIWQRFAI